MNRKRVTFAGVEFSAFDRGEHGVGVPVNILRKIVGVPGVRIRRNYSYSDDYKGDADADFNKADNLAPAVILNDLKSYGKPWLCYLKDEELRFCPFQALSYTITAK